MEKFLVAARIDRGGLPVSQERINDVCKRYGFAKFFQTSAKRGDGITELAASIRNTIMWDRLPRGSAPASFYETKAFLLREKQDGRVMARRGELFQQYRKTAALALDEPERVFDTCLGLLGGRSTEASFVWRPGAHSTGNT